VPATIVPPCYIPLSAASKSRPRSRRPPAHNLGGALNEKITASCRCVLVSAPQAAWVRDGGILLPLPVPRCFSKKPMTDTNSVGSDARLAARYIDGYLRLGPDVLADQLTGLQHVSAKTLGDDR
jgi:hypothetical protein